MINMLLRELFGVSIGFCCGKVGLHSWAYDFNISPYIIYCSKKGCRKVHDNYWRFGNDKKVRDKYIKENYKLKMKG